MYNSLIAITRLGEPKDETQVAQEVANLCKVETFLLEIILVILVLLRPIVIDAMSHPAIKETSLAAASAIAVEK